jgi:hypothetical protein
MSLKLSFSNEIHRVSKPPVSYSALISHSQVLFSSKLPSTWGLEYLDEENDRVVLSSDHDYQSLLEDVSKGKSVKIFIVEKFENNSLALENFEKILEPEPEVISHPESKNAPQFEELKITDVSTSRSVQFNPELDKIEPKSPKNTGKIHHKFKVLGLMKKLAKPDIPKEEREKWEAKLKKIMGKLSPEDLQWVTQQANNPKGTKNEKQDKPKPHLRFKAAALIKKLKEADLPIEIQREKEAKLNAIKQKLSPEDLKWAEENSSAEVCREKCKGKAQFKAACLIRKIGDVETSKEDRERFQAKLTQIKDKLSPEDLQQATEQAAKPGDENDRKPMLKYKIRNIMRRLIFEPEMSPDDRKELEKRLSEFQAKMDPENLAWVEEKKKKLQEKLQKVEKKREKGLKEKIASFLKDSAHEIAGMIAGEEKQAKPAKLMKEFSDVFAGLSQEKQKEINDVMKGIPQKIVELISEKKKLKEARKLSKEKRSLSKEKKPKKRSKSPQKKEDMPKRCGFFRKQKAELEAEAKGYLNEVSKKYDNLKEVFPEADEESLLEFVDSNRALSTEELIESYLAGKN